jgi:hypothetical protein
MRTNRALGVLASSLIILGAAGTVPAQTESTLTLDGLYRRIKGIEGVFPFAAPTKTLRVGTFNAATNQFVPASGLKRRTTNEFPAIFGHPSRERFLQAQVKAVNVTLRFDVVNSQGSLEIAINGRTVQAAPGQNSVSVDVGRENDFVWTLRSGSARLDDELVLTRPPILGAGAFRVPAVPVLLVYEPPQDSARQNTASLTVTTSLGTSTSISFSGTQTISSQFLSAPQLAGKLGEAIAVFTSQMDNPPANPFVTAMQNIVDALPTGSSSTGRVTSDTSDRTLSLTFTETQTFPTEAQLGPGRGDLFGYLSNVRMIWAVTSDGQVFLSLLGADRLVLVTAQDLAQQIRQLANVAGGNPEGGGGSVRPILEALQSVLNLDPFATGRPLRGNPRFVGPDEDPNLPAIELRSGAAYMFEVTHSVTQDDKQSREVETTSTEDTSPGFLSVLLPLLGSPQNETIQTSLSQTSTRTVTVGQDERASVSLHAEANDHYAVQVYFDRVFGTFAFESIPVGSTPVIEGRVRNPSGIPVPGQVVTFQNARAKFLTVTNNQGAYSFSMQAIGAGSATLSAAGGRTNVLLNPGTPLLSADIVAPAR